MVRLGVCTLLLLGSTRFRADGALGMRNHKLMVNQRIVHYSLSIKLGPCGFTQLSL